MTLEKLLNILCEKGWKPFGWEDIKRINNEGWFVCFVHKSKKRPWLSEVSHRELVSKESNLWQFVCENGMVKHDQYTNTTRIQEYEDERDSETYRTKYGEGSYLFRLIQCSLKDDSELEQFLLDNIKVDE